MNSARTPSRRLLLVADRRLDSSAARSTGVRRFRLARIGAESRPAAPAAKRA